MKGDLKMAKIETYLVKDLGDLANIVSDSFQDIVMDMNDITARIDKLEKVNKKLGLVCLGLTGLLYLQRKKVFKLELKVNEFSDRLKVEEFIKGEDKQEENDLK